MAWRGITTLLAALVVVFGVFVYYLTHETWSGINIPIQGGVLLGVILCLVLTVVISLGMAWSVLRTCSPEDDKRPPSTTRKDHRGEQFHCTGRPTAVGDLRQIVLMERSVGLIEIKNGIKTVSSGTGFLVGDGYLLSAYHVFKDRIDGLLQHIAGRIQENQDSYKLWIENNFSNRDSEMTKQEAVKRYFHDLKKTDFLQIVDDLSRVIGTEKSIDDLKEKVQQKWCQWCIVKFGSESTTPDQFSFQPNIPFADEENDVIILRLEMKGKTTVQMQRFMLDEGDPPSYGKALVCGFLRYIDKSPKQLFLDSQCQLYTSDEKLTQDIESAANWWKSQLKTSSKGIDISGEYYGCSPNCNRETGCTTMHTTKSFVHGTSGSPVIVMAEVNNERQPVVTAMYLQGYPRFYYDLQNFVRNKQDLPDKRGHFKELSKLVEQNENNPDMNVIDLKYFFESGITMQHLARLLDNHPSEDVRRLRENIFDGKGSISAGGGDSLLNSVSRVSSFGGEHFHDREQESLTDRVLRALAKRIPSEWKGVMIYMGFPNDEINIACKNNPRDVVECAFTCLQKWRNMNSNRAVVELEKDLIDALDFEGRSDLIEYLDKEFSIKGQVSSPISEVNVSPEEDTETRCLPARASEEDWKFEGMDVLDQKKKDLIADYFDSLPSSLKVECFDVLIVCHEDEKELAAKYSDHLNHLYLQNGRKLKATLLEDAELVSLSGSILEIFEEAFTRSTFTCLFMSDKFVQDSWSQHYAQTSLVESIDNEEKKWSILPIYSTKKSDIKKIPLYLKNLLALDYGNHGQGKFHDAKIIKLVSDKCYVWKKRNDELQDKRYKEALKQHQMVSQKS